MATDIAIDYTFFLVVNSTLSMLENNDKSSTACNHYVALSERRSLGKLLFSEVYLKACLLQRKQIVFHNTRLTAHLILLAMITIIWQYFNH